MLEYWNASRLSHTLSRRIRLWYPHTTAEQRDGALAATCMRNGLQQFIVRCYRAYPGSPFDSGVSGGAADAVTRDEKSGASNAGGSAVAGVASNTGASSWSPAMSCSGERSA